MSDAKYKAAKVLARMLNDEHRPVDSPIHQTEHLLDLILAAVRQSLRDELKAIEELERARRAELTEYIKGNRKTHTDNPALAQAERQMNRGPHEELLEDLEAELESAYEHKQDFSHIDGRDPGHLQGTAEGKVEGLELALRIVKRHLASDA